MNRVSTFSDVSNISTIHQIRLPEEFIIQSSHISLFWKDHSDLVYFLTIYYSDQLTNHGVPQNFHGLIN